MLLTSTFNAQTGTAFAAYADRQRAVSGTAQPWVAPSGGPGSPPRTGRRPGIRGTNAAIDRKQPQKEATRT